MPCAWGPALGPSLWSAVSMWMASIEDLTFFVSEELAIVAQGQGRLPGTAQITQE